MTRQHLSICPIADGKHLHPYQCCCQIIMYTQRRTVEYMLSLCKHSVIVPCWNCKDLAEELIAYRFEEEHDVV